VERPKRADRGDEDDEIPSAVEVPDQPLGPSSEDLERNPAEEAPGKRMPGLPTDGEPPAAS